MAATVLNGVAIACFIGATFGPWLNPALNWSWNNLLLLFGASVLHALAQVVLSLGFEKGTP